MCAGVFGMWTVTFFYMKSLVFQPLTCPVCWGEWQPGARVCGLGWACVERCNGNRGVHSTGFPPSSRAAGRRGRRPLRLSTWWSSGVVGVGSAARPTGGMFRIVPLRRGCCAHFRLCCGTVITVPYRGGGGVIMFPPSLRAAGRRGRRPLRLSIGVPEMLECNGRLLNRPYERIGRCTVLYIGVVV